VYLQADKEYGRTPLMMCGFDPQQHMDFVDKQCVKIGKLLVGAGASVRAVDKLGWNALHLAALRGLGRYSKFLIHQVYNETMQTRSKEVPMDTDKGTTTGATTNVDIGDHDDIQLGNDSMGSHQVIEYINHKDEDGRTAIMKAISHGHFGAVKIIRKYFLQAVEAGTNTRQDTHQSIQRDYNEFLQVVDNYNATVLHYAVQSALANHTNVPILQELLRRPNATASTKGSGDNVNIFVDMTDVDGRTPLMYAVIGHPKHLIPLFDRTSAQSAAALAHAAEKEAYLTLIRDLLAAGADPRLIDGFGVSAQSMCPVNSHIVRELLANAAVDKQMQEYEAFVGDQQQSDEF
jgi:ankyrin repeat protein